MSATIITVQFRSDTLFAVERDDGVFVAVTPICETLGIASEAQRGRIQGDPILSEGAAMIVLPSPGGNQETLCLKLEMVNGWLFGIDEGRVKDEETRQRVLAYKRECYAVLFNYFYGQTANVRARAINAGSFTINESEPVLARRSLVTEARQTHGTQAARELWFKLGLPTTPAMYADARQGDFFYTAIRKDAPPA